MLRHHLLATIQLSPVPTSAKEVDFLYRAFKRLGNMESFAIERDKTGHALYEQNLRILYSPLQGSILRPSDDFSASLAEYTDEALLVSRKNALAATLSRLIAIPRYSYLENDTDFWSGRSEVRFKHSLPRDALHLDKRYEISAARDDCLFHSILGDVDCDELRRKARFNYQKYHKFVVVSLRDYDRVERRRKRAVDVLAELRKMTF